MMEVWRDVIGMEEYLSISSEGNIVVKERSVNNNGGLVNKKSRLGKPHNNGTGYLQFRIDINGVTYRKYVHVMVAEAFIEKPSVDGLEVNHKNGIKSDNCVGNLEWVTRKENINHAIDNGLIVFPEKRVRKEKCKHCDNIFEYSSSKDRKYCSIECSSSSSRKVKKPTKSELIEMLNIYNFEEIGRNLGVNSNSVRKWCKTYDMSTVAKSYETEYKRKKYSKERSERQMGKNGRRVGKFSLDGEFIEEYNSISEARRDIGVYGIDKVLSGERKTAGGFKWEYMD